MLTRRLTIRSEHRLPSQSAFVKRYEAPPDFTFPENFDLAKHNLLLLESIRCGRQVAVLLYWASEERARALEPVVEKALGVSDAEVIGQVVQVLTPTMPKWTENPVKWGKWLVSVAALVGALSIIRDYFTELFGWPNVVIFAGNSAAANFHAGDPLDIPLVVRNEARLGQASVHLDAVRLNPMEGPGSPDTLHTDIAEVPQLQAGQNAEVRITGISPTPHDPRPQRYALEVQAKAKEGFFWRARKVSYRQVIITFWPDRSTEIQVVQTSPSTARVEITLKPGLASNAGLRGQLTFTSVAPPEANGIALMSGAVATEAPIIAANPTGIVAKVQFQTSSLQPFRRYSYRVSIAFRRPLTNLEWTSLRSSMKVTFA